MLPPLPWVTGLPLAGRLQLPPGAGRAVLNCAAGRQPESAAGVYLTAQPAVLHRRTVCPAGWSPAKEKVSSQVFQLGGGQGDLSFPTFPVCRVQVHSGSKPGVPGGSAACLGRVVPAPEDEPVPLRSSGSAISTRVWRAGRIGKGEGSRLRDCPSFDLTPDKRTVTRLVGPSPPACQLSGKRQRQHVGGVRSWSHSEAPG